MEHKFSEIGLLKYKFSRPRRLLEDSLIQWIIIARITSVLRISLVQRKPLNYYFSYYCKHAMDDLFTEWQRHSKTHKYTFPLNQV